MTVTTSSICGNIYRFWRFEPFSRFLGITVFATKAQHLARNSISDFEKAENEMDSLEVSILVNKNIVIPERFNLKCF